jgi:hypothetical protein
MVLVSLTRRLSFSTDNHGLAAYKTFPGSVSIHEELSATCETRYDHLYVNIESMNNDTADNDSPIQPCSSQIDAYVLESS